MTDLVEGLQEAAVAVELRLKIDTSHEDLKGGYGSLHYYVILLLLLYVIPHYLELPGLSENMERLC